MPDSWFFAPYQAKVTAHHGVNELSVFLSESFWAEIQVWLKWFFVPLNFVTEWHNQNRHVDVCSCLGSSLDKTPWGVLHLSSFLSVQWLPFGWKCTPQKLFTFAFPHAGVNPPVTKHCGGDGNSNEGRIRLGAQWRQTVCPILGRACYLVYYAFCLWSLHSPAGSPRMVCEVVWVENLWTGVNGAVINRNEAMRV